MSRSGTGSRVSAPYIARSCVPISSRASSPSLGGSGWKKPGAPNGPNPFGLLVWKDIEDPAWQRGDPKGPVAPMEDNGSMAGRFRTIPPGPRKPEDNARPGRQGGTMQAWLYVLYGLSLAVAAGLMYWSFAA